MNYLNAAANFFFLILMFYLFDVNICKNLPSETTESNITVSLMLNTTLEPVSMTEQPSYFNY
jgi:hypothetical protein